MKKLVTNTLLILLALATIAITGCEREGSDTVDQDQIFTEYELFYNANEDKTYARATFKFSNIGGTRLELVGESSITFDDKELTYKPVLAYYELEMAGFVSEGSFEFTDLEGEYYKNGIEIRQIEYPQIDTINRNQSFELAWEGAPLSEFESVNLTINGENEGDAQTFLQAAIGAQSIILPKDKLEQVGAGPGTVWLDRNHTPTIKEAPDAGGVIKGRYRAENLTVQMQ